MAAVSDDLDQMPVVRELADFDRRSGNLLERLVFNNRLAMMIVCAIITLVLGYVAATKLVLNASFEKMIPQDQAYIKNYLTYQKDLRGLGNAIRVVVENTDGDIFDPQYLEALKQINDQLVLTPGVDRAWVKSLWTPAVRWTEVTEEGFRGGPVMPDNYDGSPKSVEQLKQNIAIVRNFKPMTAAEKTALLARTKEEATDGRHELFKSSKAFDSSHHRKQHGFDLELPA